MTETGCVVLRHRPSARGRAALPQLMALVIIITSKPQVFPSILRLTPVNRLSVSLATAAMTGDRVGLRITTAGRKKSPRLRSWRIISGDRILDTLTPTVATTSARHHSRHSGGEQMSLTTSRLLRSGVVWTSMRWLGSIRIALKSRAVSSSHWLTLLIFYRVPCLSRKSVFSLTFRGRNLGI